jgi:uncharacterized protein YigE (DUF2233 family)
LNLIRVMPAQGRDCERLESVAQKPDVDFLIAGSQGLSGGEEAGGLSGRVIDIHDGRRSAVMRMRMVALAAAFAGLAVVVLLTPATASDPHDRAEACEAVSHGGADYVVCRFDPGEDDIRLFLNDSEGAPYGHFNFISDALAQKGETLAFAMNAGMYHEDRSPVGLYVEEGEELASLNDNDGPGNFHLKPNGVFFVNDAGVAGVQDASVFKSSDQEVRFATQSGPMLIIDGDIHPRFLKDSDSLKRRNGAGVTADGEAIFVLADSPVRFYDFAAFFRDVLKTPNALYLDGTISRIYAPELERNDPGAAMGPIIGVVVKDD